jgi:hypothetical protein
MPYPQVHYAEAGVALLLKYRCELLEFRSISTYFHVSLVKTICLVDSQGLLSLWGVPHVL